MTTRRLWTLLLLPPVLLAALTFPLAALLVQVGGVAPDQVGRELLGWFPFVIAVNHLLVFLLLLRFLRADGLGLREIGWRVPGGSALLREVALGVVLGLALYLAYEFALDPVRDWARELLSRGGGGGGGGGGGSGGGVPVDAMGAGQRALWLAAAVTLPAVEESVYRGYGLRGLGERWGTGLAVLGTSVLFGLLHWGQGPSAMAITAVMGAALAGIFLLRERTLPAVFVAHVTYNAAAILGLL